MQLIGLLVGLASLQLMIMRLKHFLVLGAIGISFCFATYSARAITGNYLEVRSCDVYTGPCFANAEMGLTGKEGMMVWSIRSGQWNGVSLDGLSVIAVVHTQETMGDTQFQPRKGRSVLIVDSKADKQQRDALLQFVASRAGDLVSEVVSVRTSSIEANLGTCTKNACGSVKAEGLVDVTTRCVGDHDHICGNEELFYPPLTSVKNPTAAYTEWASYKGQDLNVTWCLTDQRGSYLASFEY